jgi:hypothetical protein
MIVEELDDTSMIVEELDDTSMIVKELDDTSMIVEEQDDTPMIVDEQDDTSMIVEEQEEKKCALINDSLDTSMKVDDQDEIKCALNNESLKTSMIVEEDDIMLLQTLLGNRFGAQRKSQNISTQLSDNKDPSIDFCNSLISTVNHTNFPRGCRSMEIGDVDFTNLSNPSVSTFVALISAYGAGLYTTWYIFKNVKIYFIFRTYNSEQNNFNWSCQETSIDEVRRWSYR